MTMRSLFLALLLSWSCNAATADFVLNTVRQENYSLKVTGEIRPGDVERLVLIFDGKKRFPLTTRIDVNGGDLEEAMQLGALLRQAHLSVMADDNCRIACFVVLVGGVSRAISSELILDPPPGYTEKLAKYLGGMGVANVLVSDIVSSDAPVTVSLQRFDQEVGESPAVLKDAIVARCGQFSSAELADFRSLEAYRFVESLKLLEARSGRSEELAPIIAKYEALAEEAGNLGFEYRQRLTVQWEDISECRKQVLHDAQDAAMSVVGALSRKN